MQQLLICWFERGGEDASTLATPFLPFGLGWVLFCVPLYIFCRLQNVPNRSRTGEMDRRVWPSLRLLKTAPLHSLSLSSALDKTSPAAQKSKSR